MKELRLLLQLLTATLLSLTYARGQQADENTPFRSRDNKCYWGNKKPYPDYWQQDIHYRIKASVNEKTDILDGSEELTYWNNSPKPLEYVYFHLFQNAYQPGSYYDELVHATGQEYHFGKYQAKKLGVVVESLESDKTVTRTETDNTLVKVFLKDPILPGDSAVFRIRFKTYFDIGAEWGRMEVFDAWGNRHYNGGHWYPRISVYDRKFGWTTDQHLGHEFYGDFGTYDVELTFASNFIVDATGILVNREEVMPDELRRKLDIRNFKDKKMDEPPSVIIPYDSTKRKTWIFHADNVIDFAFLADPTFRIGEAEWNGIKCVALAQEPHAARWQSAADLCAKTVEIYSRDFGMYEYPKMIVSDARSGMEYPMLTMDSELDPDYSWVIVHEIGHNWFFGMLSNNETYQAPMDEGFTQFLTAWSLSRLKEKQPIFSPAPSRYLSKHQQVRPVPYTVCYENYLHHALFTGGTRLNQHSDMFSIEGDYWSDYRQVYEKTAVMLYNLQYVLGDGLFLKTMQNYVKQWKFCHPYFEDFRRSVISFSGVDLNWFFDQWFESEKYTDYAVDKVKKLGTKEDWSVTFKRRGSMQMPLDFEVIAKNDSVYSYHLPNDWFVKQFPEGQSVKVLDKWLGFNELNRKHTVSLHVPGGIRNVVIDPSQRLADLDLLNNSKKFPFRGKFDYLVFSQPDWAHYEMFFRPDLWWNSLDGLKAGVHLRGSYMRQIGDLDASLWYNTGLVQGSPQKYVNEDDYQKVSYRINFSTVPFIGRKSFTVSLSLKHLDGLNAWGVRLDEWDKSNRNRYYLGFRSLFVSDSASLNYFLYPEQWSLSGNPSRPAFNNYLYIGTDHYFREGSLNLNLRSAAFGSDYQYTSASLTLLKNKSLGLLYLKTRGFVQYAFGRSMPDESALYLAGANPEEMSGNKFTRARGFIDDQWLGYGITTSHFQAGGGLNLRGFAGYLAACKDKNGEVTTVYKGSGGAALNAELEFDRLFKLEPALVKNTLKINTYLFGDIGVINSNRFGTRLALADVRADAGVGAALTIKKWWHFQTPEPFTIRIDFPLFLNHIPAVESDQFRYRWIIGINRAF